MVSLLLQPVRQFVDALLANDSPRQVAAGCTLGMMLGLVPKDNLIAVALGMLLCALRVNRPAGLAVAGIVSMISPSLDGLTHLLGRELLEVPALQATFAWIYDQPLGPWWGFHNTVVMGALILGLYLSYPTYWICRVLWARFQPRLAAHAAKYRVVRWLSRADFAVRLES